MKPYYKCEGYNFYYLLATFLVKYTYTSATHDHKMSTDHTCSVFDQIHIYAILFLYNLLLILKKSYYWNIKLFIFFKICSVYFHSLWVCLIPVANLFLILTIHMLVGNWYSNNLCTVNWEMCRFTFWFVEHSVLKS